MGLRQWGVGVQLGFSDREQETRSVWIMRKGTESRNTRRAIGQEMGLGMSCKKEVGLDCM